MTLHLRKLSGGIESIENRAASQAMRRTQRKERGEPAISRHVTRMWPKRADELLTNSGSMFWVIKGVMQSRQVMWDFEEV